MVQRPGMGWRRKSTQFHQFSYTRKLLMTDWPVRLWVILLQEWKNLSGPKKMLFFMYFLPHFRVFGYYMLWSTASPILNDKSYAIHLFQPRLFAEFPKKCLSQTMGFRFRLPWKVISFKRNAKKHTSLDWWHSEDFNTIFLSCQGTLILAGTSILVVSDGFEFSFHLRDHCHRRCHLWLKFEQVHCRHLGRKLERPVSSMFISKFNIFMHF